MPFECTIWWVVIFSFGYGIVVIEQEGVPESERESLWSGEGMQNKHCKRNFLSILLSLRLLEKSSRYLPSRFACSPALYLGQQPPETGPPAYLNYIRQAIIGINVPL